MERLTVFDGEFWVHKDFPPVGLDTIDEFVDCVKELAARLASIEDILGDDYNLDRLREIAAAERDGRCVVLPCKVGDTVWFNTYSCNAEVCHGIQPHEVKDIRSYVIVEGEHTDVGLSTEQFDKTWFLEKTVAKATLKGGSHVD